MSTVLPSAAHVPADAVNSYAVFRGTLSGAVTGIRVYANRFYELRIDGELIAYGPVRSREPLLYYDVSRQCRFGKIQLLPGASLPNQSANDKVRPFMEFL